MKDRNQPYNFSYLFVNFHFSTFNFLRIVPNTPLINPGLPSAPYFFASSTASSMITFGGFFFSITSSHDANRRIAKSILLIFSSDHSGAAALIRLSTFLLCRRTLLASGFPVCFFETNGRENNDFTASSLRICRGSVETFTFFRSDRR